MTTLAEDELPLVIEFLRVLEQRSPRVSLTVAEIRELAKERARLLAEVPREVLMERFFELAERIRQKVISRGTAVDGDWTGD